MAPSIRTVARAAGWLATAAGIVACSQPQDSNGSPLMGGPQLAHVRIVMSQSASGPPAATAPAPAADQARISASNVSSLTVTVTSIQFLQADSMPADSTGAADSGWIELTLDQPAPLDLLALPTAADQSPIVIASGTVAEGSYRQVRLFVSDATITFASDVTVGKTTFTAGTAYPVTIPSADQTGIKTDVAFDVVADAEGTVADVPLLFDPTATFVNAAATGSGSVMLAPVIRAGRN